MALSSPSPTQFIYTNPTFKCIAPLNLQTLILISSTPIQNPRIPSSIHLHPIKINHRRRNQKIHSNPKVRASISTSQRPQPPPSNSIVIVVCSAITLVLAIANRVLYKLALVPMKKYPFFLAQLNTFGFVAIYFSILCMRYRAGIVTDEMIAFPKSRFVLIGFLEALGVVTGMSAGDIFVVAVDFLCHSSKKKVLVEPNFWMLTCGCWSDNGGCKVSKWGNLYETTHRVVEDSDLS